MQEIIDFDEPTRVIMHFKEDAQLCAQHGHRLVHYQVLIDNDPSCYSPDGEFIRFEHETSEVHGWQEISSIVIDTILEIESEGEWVRSANG